MTSKHGESDKQQNAAGDEDSTTPQQHSQTLPLITEELAASRAATEKEPNSAPSQHPTTPVMPPNPIRRETPPQDTPVRRQDAKANGASSTASAAEPAHPTDTRIATAAENGPEDGKKSEGRISATQLLAGAGAAATSSVVGGQLGVAGTVVGAGIASIITGLAVTIYGRSLDKGKEKIKEVGSKLAPAVKAQMAKGGPGSKAGTAHGLRSETAFASAPATDDTAATEAAAAPAGDSTGTAAEGSQTWWQKLRRKRVLYPVTIGVAAFGIGLGAVVMAESVTGADISPGTSQISRAVSGNTGSGEETGADGGSEGSSDSGSSGSGSGSQPGTDSSTGTVNDGSNEGGASSAGESDSEGTTSGTQSDPGADSSSSTNSDTSGSTSSDGAGDSGTSDSSGSGTGGQGQTGSDGSGGGSSSGGDSSAGGSGGSGASSGQG